MTTPNNENSGGRTARAITLLGVAYPIAAHLAVLSGRNSLIAASVGFLVLLVLLPGLLRLRAAAWVLLLIAGAGIYLAAVRDQVLLLLFLPPILINGFMAWLFGHTLRSGRQPLIERIIRALHGGQDDIDITIVEYARRLTLAWTTLFVSLATVNLALAVLAAPGGLLIASGRVPPVTVPLETWSLFANVINYLIVGAMFAIEFQVRRKRFPQQSYRGFFDFLRRLSVVSSLFRPSGLQITPPADR